MFHKKSTISRKGKGRGQYEKGLDGTIFKS